MSSERNGHASSPTVPVLPARTVLDSYFLEARCKLLDIAAILDRLHRGEGAGEIENDQRLARIRQALEVLLDRSQARAGGVPENEMIGRAERIQQIFSLEYDPGWEVPQPRD